VSKWTTIRKKLLVKRETSVTTMHVVG